MRHQQHTQLCLSVFTGLLSLLLSLSSLAEIVDHSMHNQSGHQDHNMTVDVDGLVMNNNTTTLPEDCTKLGPDIAFSVYAGTEYAAQFPGTVFGLSNHEYRVEPCSRVTVTFINKDSVRHQWMVHGLPKYLYPQGMFHLEAAGGKQRTGTFIVPSDNKTYLVHCDMAQHMEKGMKAQLLVGKGNGNLWSVPGISQGFLAEKPRGSKSWLLLIVAATLTGFLMMFFLLKRKS